MKIVQLQFKHKKEMSIEKDVISYFPKINDVDFERLRNFIENKIGIKVSNSKRILLETRLFKRLKALGFKNFGEYCNYVFEGNNREELINLIDHVTTNKTDFFRESAHFNFLTKTILPEICEKSFISIWSCACSTGEEPYTIAMVLKENIDKKKLRLEFEIFASDISMRALATAIKAIYPYDKIYQVPKSYYKYFLKSKDPSKGLIRVTSEIRKYVNFARINLMEKINLNKTFDIIFCRNVLIYFDKKTQKKVIDNLYSFLKKGGYLFLGHSEALYGIETNFRKIVPSIYMKE